MRHRLLAPEAAKVDSGWPSCVKTSFRRRSVSALPPRLQVGKRAWTRIWISGARIHELARIVGRLMLIQITICAGEKSFRNVFRKVRYSAGKVLAQYASVFKSLILMRQRMMQEPRTSRYIRLGICRKPAKCQVGLAIWRGGERLLHCIPKMTLLLFHLINQVHYLARKSWKHS